MRFARFLNLPPGLLLIVAAIFKSYQLIENPVAFGKHWNVTLIGTLVVFSEFVIGWLLLLPRILEKRTKYFGLAVFSIFLAYSLFISIFSDNRSCGCFGIVEVPMFIVSIVDLAMIICLCCWVYRFPSSDSCYPRKFLLSLVLGFSGTAALALEMHAANFIVKDLDALEFVEGDFIIISPEDWTEKKFPLGRFVKCDEIFSGDWTVIFYNEGCMKCEHLFREIYANKTPQRFLLVKVISSSEETNVDSERIRWRIMPKSYDWFVESPKILEMSGGIVKTVK